MTRPPSRSRRWSRPAGRWAGSSSGPGRPPVFITDIIDSVVGVCTKARTGLVLADELHNISLTTRHGAEVADALKYFSERIAATFIYAGIDIEHSSLLSGTRGAQIARLSP